MLLQQSCHSWPEDLHHANIQIKLTKVLWAFWSYERGNLNVQKGSRVWRFHKHSFILQFWCPLSHKPKCITYCLLKFVARRCWGLFGIRPAGLHVNNSVIIDFISFLLSSALFHLFLLALLMHLKVQQALHVLWGCKKQDSQKQTKLQKTLFYIFITLCRNIVQV